ncbi:MAG: biotin transporter BioY, partial [Rikenellaceae bacterium]|nr:biotin transporter BioY [Rikenellaceae bacterium]
DMLEKSNLFLENVIRTAGKPMDDREVVHYFSSPLDDGGAWNLYYNIARKYGVVPKTAMPETEHSNNTGQLVNLLKEKLRREGYLIRESAASGKREPALRHQKTQALKDIYRILALCLGEPPREFTWRYKEKNGTLTEKTYTPLEFYAAITPEDYSPEQYIMIMNDPTREYYKMYEIQNYRNSVEGINWTYLNLPNTVIKQAALASIKNDEGMYASCDVGKQHNRAAGIMDPQMYDYASLFGVFFDMPKQTRILTRQSGSSHAMLLIGCDTDENDRPIKWEFENSWGPAAGNRGYLTFTDEWFDEYMFRLVIHRRYLDPKSVAALDQPPVQLPPWDYMF